MYIYYVYIYNINIYTVEPKYIQPGYTWIHLGYFVWLFPTWRHPGTATAWAVEPLTERLVTNAAAGTVYSLPSMQCAGHGKQSEREAGSSISRNMLYLLVVLTILKNMLVNGTDYPIYYGQFQKCLKPPTSISIWSWKPSHHSSVVAQPCFVAVRSLMNRTSCLEMKEHGFWLASSGRNRYQHSPELKSPTRWPPVIFGLVSPH